MCAQKDGETSVSFVLGPSGIRTTGKVSSCSPISTKKCRQRRPQRNYGIIAALSDGKGPVSGELAPVVIFPGLGNAASDYSELALKLRLRGHASVTVVPIRRWLWSLNVRGFFTKSYWSNTLTPSPILDWYFSRVHATILKVTAEHNRPVNVLGHSAGGWLASIYLAERSDPQLHVQSLVTLGTPHVAPPVGRLDQTRGLLTYVDSNCNVVNRVDDFVCVAGHGTMGRPLGKGSLGQYIAFLSYAAVCGEGAVDGDGVTPVQAACARGAKLIQCDCDHSMLTSPERWYGSDDVLENWVGYLS